MLISEDIEEKNVNTVDVKSFLLPEKMVLILLVSVTLLGAEFASIQRLSTTVLHSGKSMEKTTYLHSWGIGPERR